MKQQRNSCQRLSGAPTREDFQQLEEPETRVHWINLNLKKEMWRPFTLGMIMA